MGSLGNGGEKAKPPVPPSTRVYAVYGWMGFGLAINYLLGIAISRLIGVVDFGLYSVGLSVFGVLSAVGLFAFDSAVIRLLPKIASAGDDRRVRLFSGTVILMAAVTSLAVGVVLACSAPWISEVVLGTNRLAVVLRSFGALLPLLVLATVFVALMQAHEIVASRMALRYGAEPGGRAIVGISTACIGAGACAPILGSIVGCLITVLGSMMILGRHGRPMLSRSGIAEHSRLTIGFSAPLMLGGIAAALASRIDVVAIGHLSGEVNAGIYAAALQTSAMLVIVLQGIDAVFLARFSRLFAVDAREELRREYQRAGRLALLVASPIVAAVLAAPGDLLRLFGNEFRDGAVLLVVLTMGQLVNIVTGPANSLLLVAGRTWQILRNNLLFSASLMVFVPLAGMRYGAIGVAAVVAVATAALNLSRVWQVRVELGLWPYSTYFLRALGALFLTIGLRIGCGDSVGVLGIVIYPAIFSILVVLFGLHPEDRTSLGIKKRRSES